MVEPTQELRCTNCGAPLTLASDKDIVTCGYCGIPQQRANAEKYMAQLRTEVFGWIKTMIPTGVQSASQGDPIARSQLFEHVVRPRVEEELNSRNMQLIKLGSGVLFPPLFTSTAKLESEIPLDSKSFLADSARFQGLLPLPQTEDQISFMTDAVATTEALGYISNAARQLSEPTGRSFKTIAKNFQSASESLSNSEPKKAGAKRMEGLALLSTGIDSILEGDATDASLKLQEAVERFKVALTEIMGALGLASWYPSIKSEGSITESVSLVVKAAQAGIGAGSRPIEIIQRFEKYVKSFEAARTRVGGILSTSKQIDAATFKEICGSFSDAVQAKFGTLSINALGGSGNLWIACWLADLNYSFETGVLFMKKGQAVQERLLIPGTVSLFPERISSAPQEIATDIFSVTTPSGFWDRVSGKEKTITTGLGLSVLAQTRKSTIPPSSLVVPIYCTKAEAERAANLYLEKARQRLSGKLKIGIPSVTQMVYVGGETFGGRLRIPGLPDSMSPYVGDTSTLQGLAV